MAQEMQVVLCFLSCFVKKIWKSTYRQDNNLKPKTAYLENRLG